MKKRKEIRGVGRPLQYPAKFLTTVAAETLAEIDAALVGDETRLDLVREAIDRELTRRMRLWSQRNLTGNKNKRREQHDNG